MAYFFSGIVEEKEFRPAENFRAVDGTNHPYTNRVQDGSVYQHLPDGRRVHVCFLQKICAFSVDRTAIKVQYSDGCLTFEECYDGPIRTEYKQHFAMEDKLWIDFTLHHYYAAGASGGRGETRCWLECEERYYPVWVEKETITRITVYDPEGEVSNGMLLHKPLAVIASRTVALDRVEYRVEYSVRMEELKSSLLCMAICALPVLL